MIGLVTQRKIGQLKIAKENQTENRFCEIDEYHTLSTSLIDQLPDSFYSLGESSEYYKQIKEYFNDSNLELLLLNKLKDIENNKSKFENLKKPLKWKITIYTKKKTLIKDLIEFRK